MTETLAYTIRTPTYILLNTFWLQNNLQEMGNAHSYSTSPVRVRIRKVTIICTDS